MFISLAELTWTILAIPIIFYICYRLSTINRQLEKISKHLNIQEDEIEEVSNEEIEKELEEKLRR